MMDKIKNLREKTGAGVIDIKRAFDEAGGDEKKAVEIIRKQGLGKAGKRSERETSQGLIDSYIHLGKIGVLVEVNCETDFVVRNKQFKEFTHEIALQVAQSEAKDVDTLLQEKYFKDPEKTIDDLLKEIIVKTGENIKVKRFAKYSLGE